MPDCELAVNDAYLAVITNQEFAPFDKGTGVPLAAPTPFDTFFAPLPLTVKADPEILWDADPLLAPSDRRWYAAAIHTPSPFNFGNSPNAFMVNVSATTNPAGAWLRFNFPLPACEAPPPTEDTWWHLDSANLAVDHEFVYVDAILRNVEANDTTNYRNATYSLDKAALLSGMGSVVGKAFEPRLNEQPAQGAKPSRTVEDTLAVRYSYDDTPQYIVSLRVAEQAQTVVDLGHLSYAVMTNDPCTNTQDPATIVRVPLTLPAGYREPAVVDQPELFDPTPAKINAFDARAWNAVYRDGSLWFCHHLSKPEAPDRVVVRWYEVAMNDWGLKGGGTPALVQWGEIDPQSMAPVALPGERRHAYFPSIAVGPGGDMAVCYNRSTSFYEWISIRVAGRRSFDPLGTLTHHATLKSSQSAWYIGTDPPGEPRRWGDYSDIVPDEGLVPGEGGDPCVFWTHHEYVFEPPPLDPEDPQTWATWVAPWSVCDP